MSGSHEVCAFHVLWKEKEERMDSERERGKLMEEEWDGREGGRKVDEGRMGGRE